MTFEELQWAGWPSDRPRPTPEEYAAAEKRYSDEIDAHLAAVERGEQKIDGSDWGCSFSFVMATYTRPCWWHYFFPDEKLEFKF